MPELLFSLRFWMAGCFLLGAAAGAATRGRQPRAGVAGWFLWMGAAALAGATALLLGAVKGPAALSLAAALAFYIAYLPGAAVGAIIAGGGLRGHEGWALGLAPLALIWWAAIAAGPAQLAPPTPQTETGVAVSPDAAPGTTPEHLSTADAGNAAAKGPADLAETPARLCQQRLAAVAAMGDMTFARGKSTINRRMAVALDAAALAIRDCAVDAIEVIAGGDDGGTDPADRLLAQKRATAVVLYLRREGLGGRTVRPVDPGVNAPLGGGSISFIVR